MCFNYQEHNNGICMLLYPHFKGERSLLFSSVCSFIHPKQIFMPPLEKGGKLISICWSICQWSVCWSVCRPSNVRSIFWFKVANLEWMLLESRCFLLIFRSHGQKSRSTAGLCTNDVHSIFLDFLDPFADKLRIWYSWCS